MTNSKFLLLKKKSKFDVCLDVTVYFVFLVFISLSICHLSMWLEDFPFFHKIDPNYLEYFWFCVIFVALLFSLSLFSERLFLIFLLMFFFLTSCCILLYWYQVYSVPVGNFFISDNIPLNFFLSLDRKWTRWELFKEIFLVFEYLAEYHNTTISDNLRDSCADLLLDELLSKKITTKSGVRVFVFDFLKKNASNYDLPDLDSLLKFNPPQISGLCSKNYC